MTPDRDAVVRELMDAIDWSERTRVQIAAMLERAFEAGQAHEREAVVGWLRDEAEVVEAPMGKSYYAQLGDAKETLKAATAAIDAGHHTKGEGK